MMGFAAGGAIGAVAAAVCGAEALLAGTVAAFGADAALASAAAG
jgi:hypothetical protein